MQRSSEVKAAKSSWLAQKVSDKKKIPALLNLLPVKDEVLAVAAGMGKADLKKSFSGFQKDVLAIHGVDHATLIADFAAAERYCNDPRNSIVSSTGSIVSNSSIFSRSSTRSSLFSVLSNYSDQALIEQRFYCPSCGADYSRSNDMDNHMRNKCEDVNLLRYKCYDCGTVEKVMKDMLDHVKRHNTPPRQALGFCHFPLPEKQSFGCPHCEMSFPALTAYQDHLTQQHFLKEKIDNRGSPSKRVRAGIIAAGLIEDVQAECRRRCLPEDRWETLEWDDANAWWFWEDLEHGVKDENDDHSYMGIVDVPAFVAALVDKGLRQPQSDNTALLALIDNAGVSANVSGQLPFSANETPPLVTAGPSSPPFVSLSSLPSIPPVAHHPRLDQLRKDGKLPLRNLPAQLPMSRTHQADARSGTGKSPSPALSEVAGHKHSLSAGSALHPDDLERSRNSPVPPSHQLPIGVGPIHYHSGQPSVDELECCGVDSFRPYDALLMVPGSVDPTILCPPQSVMEWDDDDD